MYHHYPNSNPNAEVSGSFTAEEARRGIVELHTDYDCPFCGRNQSVAQLGGYGGRCIQCGSPSDSLGMKERLDAQVQL